MFFLPRWWTERIGNCRANAMVVQGLVQPNGLPLNGRRCLLERDHYGGIV
ncbi:MAG: hypothetical protein H2174_10520 [Vampirovibrio sp.]|nr:hypothetical protein [Vampirovibrio sp.]